MGDERGISQAEAMQRRVSPEGRRLAKLEAERQRRRTWRIVGQVALAVLAIAALVALWRTLVGPPGPAVSVIALLALALSLVGVVLGARRSPTIAAETAPLPALPDRTGAFLAEQRRLLPAPAVTLIDAIGARVDALAPQLATLDPATPAADDVRKLLGRELPGLVGQYHAVPATLRGEEANAQLLHGLGTVDRQLDELTRQIAAGAVDGLATQDRYLDSKYGTGPA